MNIVKANKDTIKKLRAPASTPSQKIYDISSIDKIGKKSIVCYRIEGTTGLHILNGRLAQTLFYLVKYADKGISSLSMGTWAIRLASYVFVLKNRHGIGIIEKNYPQEDGIGTYGQYFLKTPIKIEWVINKNGKSE